MAGADCERALHEIEAYLDGELEPAVAGTLRQHLAACAPCMGRADFQRKIKELLAAKCGCENQELPESLRMRIEATWTEIRLASPGPGPDAE